MTPPGLLWATSIQLEPTLLEVTPGSLSDKEAPGLVTEPEHLPGPVHVTAGGKDFEAR